MKKWEKYTEDASVHRIQVEGGYIYMHTGSICFVPDIDLGRYQSHLRDAYNQGYKDGKEYSRLGAE